MVFRNSRAGVYDLPLATPLNLAVEGDSAAPAARPLLQRLQRANLPSVLLTAETSSYPTPGPLMSTPIINTGQPTLYI